MTTCTTNTYETAKGQAASTTGTIYGVYDMSGGAWEYVMGNYNNTLGDNSGFSSMPDSKYYDLYTNTSAITACNGGICYGHALSEILGWYSDLNYFINSNYSRFSQGGHFYDGSGAGVFYFYLEGIAVNVNASFRVVLAP